MKSFPSLQSVDPQDVSMRSLSDTITNWKLGLGVGTDLLGGLYLLTYLTGKCSTSLETSARQFTISWLPYSVFTVGPAATAHVASTEIASLSINIAGSHSLQLKFLPWPHLESYRCSNMYNEPCSRTKEPLIHLLYESKADSGIQCST